MAPTEFLSLRDLVAAPGASRVASLRSPGMDLAFGDIIGGTSLSGRWRELQGKSVLIAAKTQLMSALALIELDGVASRLVICPPDFAPDRLASVIEQADVNAIVCDEGAQDCGANAPRYICSPLAPDDAGKRASRQRTEWILPTSGTTGAPKLVAHSLEALLGAIKKPPLCDSPIVWATYYDIRRYGGLQIFLRAVSGVSTLVLSDPDEPLRDFLLRCRDAGVTHMSGTPSHWRRLLMSLHVHVFSPKYVRLSGEIADRAILDSLRAAYPDACLVHAYASTEAGVAFEVADGLEGFPASFTGAGGEVELRIEDGSLRIRSARTATRYVGSVDTRLFDENGFVDTGDMVELRDGRYFFKGRRAGVINIGGLKVHPEEVESVINLHSGVRMSLVKARRNPIMGNIIVAYVVLKGGADETESRGRHDAFRNEILAACRERLDRHKVPATIDFVASLDVIGSGKLARHHA